MLELFITSRVRRKLVILFAKYPDFKTHVRGLAKLLKEDAGNVQRELSRLEGVGFVRSHLKKNTKVYEANLSFPMFRELQGMVLKSQRRAPDGTPQRKATVPVDTPQPAAPEPGAVISPEPAPTETRETVFRPEDSADNFHQNP